METSGHRRHVDLNSEITANPLRKDAAWKGRWKLLECRHKKEVCGGFEGKTIEKMNPVPPSQKPNDNCSMRSCVFRDRSRLLHIATRSMVVSDIGSSRGFKDGTNKC